MVAASEREWGRNFFEKLSPRTNKILGIAQVKARELGKAVGEEFLLWALLEEGQSPAIAILKEAGGDPIVLREDIEQILPFGESATTESSVLTFGARQAIEFADEEATLLNLWIGSEPLQLAIVRAAKGRLGETLSKRGITEEVMREATYKHLKRNRPPQ